MASPERIRPGTPQRLPDGGLLYAKPVVYNVQCINCGGHRLRVQGNKRRPPLSWDIAILQKMPSWAERAQKKPPESPCPRGAKDTDSSGSDWTPAKGAVAGARPARSGGRTGNFVLYSKRPARFHAGGNALRGPQEGPRRGIPKCGPTHVDQWLVAARFAFASHIRVAAIVIRCRENMPFQICRQARF